MNNPIVHLTETGINAGERLCRLDRGIGLSTHMGYQNKSDNVCPHCQKVYDACVDESLSDEGFKAVCESARLGAIRDSSEENTYPRLFEM